MSRPESYTTRDMMIGRNSCPVRQLRVTAMNNESKPSSVCATYDMASQVSSLEADCAPAYETRSKKNVATRSLFFMLIVTGVVLTGTGIGLLITCRHELARETCGIFMDRQPCSPLATSTYLGCAVILATVFGFGCVGRKAMSCLLLCILLIELTFGIYLIVKRKSHLSVQLSEGLIAARGDCPEDGPNQRRRYVACWAAMRDAHGDCRGVSDRVIQFCDRSYYSSVECDDDVEPCETSDAPQTECDSDDSSSNRSCAYAIERNATRDVVVIDPTDAEVESCATSLNLEIVKLVWHHLFIEGPVLITVAPVHLIVATWLWLMRTSRRSSLKYETRIKSAVTSCFSRKATSDVPPDSHYRESLYANERLSTNCIAARSRKYVVRKLNRQTNAYATV